MHVVCATMQDLSCTLKPGEECKSLKGRVWSLVCALFISAALFLPVYLLRPKVREFVIQEGYKAIIRMRLTSHVEDGKVTKIEMDADKGVADYLLHLKPMTGESDPDFYRRLGNTVDYRIPDNAEFH